MAVPPLTDAVIERFRSDWHRLTGAACGDPALVGLSGGPDSSALALLVSQALKGIASSPSAATIDHGLRAASAAEATRAAEIARACGLPHAILAGPLPERADRTANLSARARALRYDLLHDHAEAIGARWIVTAHHADDQLETLIMRLNRRSGVRGLSGVRSVNGKLVRPLLTWSRSELEAIVATAGLEPVDDPSNVDDRFDRARLRKQLAAAPWLDARAAAHSVAALREADEAVEWAVDRAEGERCTFEEFDVRCRPGWNNVIPDEIRRRLAERCIRRALPGAIPQVRAINDAMVRLRGGGRETLAGVVWTAGVGPDGPFWHFRPAPPRRSP